MKINYRQKLLIVFVAILGLVVAWLFFFYYPQKKATADLDRQISKLTQQISRDNITITTLPALQKQVEAFNVEFDSLATLIPTKDSIAVITEAIVDLCQANNLTVEYIQPSLDALLATDDYFVKVPIDIRIRGTFLNLGHFVEDLNKLTFNYYQTDFTLERLPEELDLLINIESYIYVINPKGRI